MHIYNNADGRLIGLSAYDSLTVKRSRRKGTYCIEVSNASGSGEILLYPDRKSASIELLRITDALDGRDKIYYSCFNIPREV